MQVNRDMKSQGVVGLLPVVSEQTADAVDPLEQCVGVDGQGAGRAGQIAGVGEVRGEGAHQVGSPLRGMGDEPAEGVVEERAEKPLPDRQAARQWLGMRG